MSNVFNIYRYKMITVAAIAYSMWYSIYYRPYNIDSLT